MPKRELAILLSKNLLVKAGYMDKKLNFGKRELNKNVVNDLNESSFFDNQKSENNSKLDGSP